MKYFLFIMVIAGCFLMTACNDDDNPILPETSDNPAACITDSTKLAMLRSMRSLDYEGRLYEIEYTADYQLDKVLSAGITETKSLFGYIGSLLFDKMPAGKSTAKFGAGCSAFAVPEVTSGQCLMGRNYDFRHMNEDSTKYVDIAAIVVHTAPAGGKKSISIVDGINLGYAKGFYNDGETDLSMLMGLPYALLDGINEDGFSISILALKENQTVQDTGKPRISSTVAMRMLLDRASTVKEAVAMLKNYDMDMRGQGSSNYHFFMADATGDYAIVEYTNAKGDTIPSVMEVFTDNNTMRCVTNFYVSPTMVGRPDGWGSSHGRDRYFKMRDLLEANNYKLSTEAAWYLLADVSQPPTEEITSQTQWTSLYNLSQRTLRLAILRKYNVQYNFRIQ